MEERQGKIAPLIIGCFLGGIITSQILSIENNNEVLGAWMRVADVQKDVKDIQHVQEDQYKQIDKLNDTIKSLQEQIAKK